ncbi:hypothetical protein [Streptomyces albus]|uniref:hypothetical protein n=1 Tax=Streptomyces albus TaxID=1888 RepID=UPI00131CF7EE|nr:hypothetical protein [Streptomyces albus]
MNQSGSRDQKVNPGFGFQNPDTEKASENDDQDTRKSSRVNVNWVASAAMLISSLSALITAIKA